MDNETLKTILQLQEENTIYRRAFIDADLMIHGVSISVALSGDKFVDDFLQSLYDKLNKHNDNPENAKAISYDDKGFPVFENSIK